VFRPMKSICNEIGELPLVEDGGFSGQANRMYCGWGHRGQCNTNAALCGTIFVVIFIRLGPKEAGVGRVTSCGQVVAVGNEW
jgi:hypothetical protein